MHIYIYIYIERERETGIVVCVVIPVALPFTIFIISTFNLKNETKNKYLETAKEIYNKKKVVVYGFFYSFFFSFL